MQIQGLTKGSSAKSLIRRIQAVLEPSLLRPQYRKQVEANPELHYTFGHCYAASEALWHALGGMNGRWRPMSGRNERGTHWWLVDIKTGTIADPTKEQYTSVEEEPPYETGRRIGYLTKSPSKRALRILKQAGLLRG